MEQERDNVNGADTNDELDDAIASADDTGMVSQQQLIAEEDILLGEEGLLPEHGLLGDESVTGGSADEEGKI